MTFTAYYMTIQAIKSANKSDDQIAQTCDKYLQAGTKKQSNLKGLIAGLNHELTR